MRARSLVLVAGLFFVVVAVAAAISGGISWAIPVVLVAIIAAAMAVATKAMQRQELARHGGDEDRALRDGTEGGLPKAHVIGDDQTALGDTPEVHAEVSPHDFPKGAPERSAAEEMAEEESSSDPETTRGQADPSEREGRVEHETRTQR